VAVCAPSFAQAGVVAALREADDFVAAMVAEYGARAQQVRAALDVPVLDGAFYAFPRLGGEDLALRLLEDAGVAVVPGSVFGAAYAGHLRLSYAVSEAELAEGLQRITAALR
jgi:aminotransferase